MPYSASIDFKSVLAVAALYGLLAIAPANAADVTIHEVRAQTINEIIHIDVDVSLDFSDDAIDALRSGIPITFDVDVEINRVRRFWWDKMQIRTKQRYRITHHALSEQYLITNLVTGDRRAFLDLEDAIANLERIRGLPIAELRALSGNRRYNAAVRMKLDIEALPAPMRPIAYFSPGWRMSSRWYEWDLTS